MEMSVVCGWRKRWQNVHVILGQRRHQWWLGGDVHSSVGLVGVDMAEVAWIWKRRHRDGNKWQRRGSDGDGDIRAAIMEALENGSAWVNDYDSCGGMDMETVVEEMQQWM